MKTIKLNKSTSGWEYNGIIITKRKWSLPYSHTEYEMTKDGIKYQTETLKEMREVISDLISEN
jgi:hypothetical protein